MTAITAVVTAPTPLIDHLPPAPLRGGVPAADHARLAEMKAMNTPTVYSGINAATLPPEATIKTSASPVSEMIPVVNARRSPRNWNMRGRKPSRAKLERRGKSAKDVFAASASKSAVAIWMSRWNRRAQTHERARDLADDRHLRSGRARSRVAARKLIPRKTVAKISLTINNSDPVCIPRTPAA